MRTKRIENGALLLDKIEMSFDLVPKESADSTSSDEKTYVFSLFYNLGLAAVSILF